MRKAKFYCLFGVFMVLLIGLSSCSSVKESLYRLGFRSYKNVYMNDLKENTKNYTLYRDFSTVAKVKVTHFNKKLFEEYIKGILKGNPNTVKYKPFFEQFKKNDIYYVAFYTPDLTLNNLELERSFWSVYLSGCGRIIRPKSIKFIDKDDWRSGWLYSVDGNRWFREYIVEFPKGSCAHNTFVISSFLGTIALRFK